MDLHAQPELPHGQHRAKRRQNNPLTQDAQQQAVTQTGDASLARPIVLQRAQQMYQRALAGWAFDVLKLKERGIDRMRWPSDADVAPLDEDLFLAA